MPLHNPISEPQIPQPIARDAEVTAVMNAHLIAPDPHPQYLRPSEGDARYRLNSTPLSEGDIPLAIARDTEVTNAISTHVGAANPHPIYLRGVGLRVTINPPSMAAGALEKLFFTLNGASVGDYCAVAPVNVNLFANAAWPFLFFSVVEVANTIAVYVRNDGPVQDLAAFDIRILVINF